MTDEDLYEKAKLYGQNALHWRRKFIGLLPAINRRRIFAKKGFGSIFEFSFKIAGLNEQQVRNALNLARRFADKPTLKGLLENGDVSINKLIRVQSIANPQNEKELAEAVRILPQKALETLVRDERQTNRLEVLRAQDLNLNEDVLQKLHELKNKGFDLNALLSEFLEKREEEIFEEKDALQAEAKQGVSRHIPARVKKVLHKEYGNKCSIKTCQRQSENVHHTQTFALSKSHDPHHLVPLCKEHHRLAHFVQLKTSQFSVYKARDFT